MTVSPLAKRILLALAGVSTTAATLPSIDVQVGLSLLGAFLTGVAAFNVDGKVKAP